METVLGENAQLLDYRKIEPFQGELKDLSKENYQKLLGSFQKHGFFVPIFIWKSEGKNYCLDGHGRLRVLNQEQIKFKNTGYEIPVSYIEASSLKDAKEKLLKITSQYQTITYEGLQSYIDLAELPEVEIYEAVHYDALSLIGQEEETKKDDKAKSELECPECGHVNVPSAFKQAQS